ncbi:ABC transporter ATP-binding protein [Rhodoplanes sp. TEM]|uniref:ABC transporter ATP-binding protein n=1 Tax=Rhodoplanes TaxID=29407 RepID=UPI002350E538|nr:MULTISPECIES: ABC transporter ATP-binding protein [Rhodoplanes]MDC7983543.1 ABC transporter ATP-binding protein [Rhodoplanes sp. TEM]MDQ0354215.1 lipoprotein-releasing system ATP-binding protein [Rhodoplanes tepidamans]
MSAAAPVAPTGPLIEAVRLTRVLPETVPVTLVEDADLAVAAGEFVAVTGPSGSGKSSLLYLLGLLDQPSRGEIRLLGAPTAGLDGDARARLRLATLGFVFQFHFLLPEFTARDNVMLPMRALGRVGAAEMRERAEAILASLGLADHAGKRPDQMSGGQRQRVAVARALANAPAVILADEPTGSLDTRSGEQVFRLLRDLVDRDGTTVVAVTHSPEFAAGADRRIHMVDGRIVDDERRP